jgi:hypothetical protein
VGDARVAAHLSTILADAPKDRSADFLAEAKDHLDFADFRATDGEHSC